MAERKASSMISTEFSPSDRKIIIFWEADNYRHPVASIAAFSANGGVVNMIFEDIVKYAVDNVKAYIKHGPRQCHPHRLWMKPSFVITKKTNWDSYFGKRAL